MKLMEKVVLLVEGMAENQTVADESWKDRLLEIRKMVEVMALDLASARDRVNDVSWSVNYNMSDIEDKITSVERRLL